jgi:hypothetical protein
VNLDCDPRGPLVPIAPAAVADAVIAIVLAFVALPLVLFGLIDPREPAL